MNNQEKGNRNSQGNRRTRNGSGAAHRPGSAAKAARDRKRSRSAELENPDRSARTAARSRSRSSASRKRRQTERYHSGKNYFGLTILSVSVILIAAFILSLVYSSKSKKENIAQSGIEQETEQMGDASAPVSEEQTVSPASATIDPAQETDQTDDETDETEAPQTDQATEILAEANRLAAGYDYDAAIEKIQSVSGYEENTELASALQTIQEEKEKVKPYENMTEITHIFFHSLIVDPSKAFDGEDDQDGYNQYMCTVSEFRKVMEQMYERGYVLVSLHQIAEMKEQPDGTMKMEQNEILLPEGKIPFVLSQDDVCYYEYMDGDGFATKIIIGEDGRPTCEYINDSGETEVGEFDMIPILQAFIDEHPDFSYRGAKAAIAVTGYNGVFGYRTDPDYEGLADYQEQIEQAKQVAQCLRDNGWEIASHSYGHSRYGDVDDERFHYDADKWESTVETIVGDTDILIFAHGNDIGSWTPYEPTNERFQYLEKCGFRYFCNVDSNRYFVQYGDNYFRQGRRNIDGIRLYQSISDPANDELTDLINASEVFDSARPVPVPPVV